MATTAAIRRIPRSASAIATFEMAGSHDVTIYRSTLSRKLPPTWYWASQTFDVAGHRWRVRYHPNGNRDDAGGHISLYLENYRATDSVAEFKFTLLDRAGNPVPRYSRSSSGPCAFHAAHGDDSKCYGIEDFISWKDLEESGCLEDDRFAVRCDLSVLANSGGEMEGNADVALSSLHQHLTDLLWEKEGKDLTVEVDGEAFDVHGWLLAARSPVFRQEMLAATKEKASRGGVCHRRMEIKGMESKVFKKMLHFMYTDTLPPSDESEEEEDDRTTEGLLAAAHRYKLDKLKLMCEEKLCKHIDLDTVASTLAVAENNNCGALKAACVEFITRPGNLKAVTETEGFEKIKASCPSVLLEILIKQVA